MDTVRGVVVGQPGTGKTTYARRLVRAALAARRTVQVWTDDARDYAGLGVPVLRVTGRDAGRTYEALEGSWVVEVADTTEQEERALVEAMARGVWDRGRMLLVVDEAHRFFPRVQAAPTLERIATGGRHRGIDWVCVTQHPVYLHLLAIRAAQWVVAFRLLELNDLSRMERWAGMDPDRLRRLPDFRAIGVYLPARRVFLVATRRE